MAGDAAGQITASLTLDISKFTKALGDAQKAVESMQKTASQAASAGGGGDAAAESMKKTSEAAKKQKQSLSEVTQQLKKVIGEQKRNADSSSVYRKKLEEVQRTADGLAKSVESDIKAFNKFNDVAVKATNELNRIDAAQKKAAASAEKLRKEKSEAVKKMIAGQIQPASEPAQFGPAKPSSKIKILPAVDVNVAKEINKVSKSYAALNLAVESGVKDTKKAAAEYKKLDAALKKLKPMVGQNQEAVDALNRAMSKKAGAEIFRKNQEDARMAAEKMAMSVKGSSSKIGSFFKVMGTGIASGSRGMVMSLTNITEAFQKGQMGGRMLSTFLLGDLMDAFMIGTFVTDGFNKAAKSLGPTMIAQANMLRTIGRLFPIITVVASAAAAAFGYFAFNQDKSKKSSENAKKAIEGVSSAVSDLEFFLERAGHAQEILNEAFKDFDPTPMEKSLARARLAVAKLVDLRGEVKKLNNTLDDQNSKLSKSEKEIKKANRAYVEHEKLHKKASEKAQKLSESLQKQKNILMALRSEMQSLIETQAAVEGAGYNAQSAELSEIKQKIKDQKTEVEKATKELNKQNKVASLLRANAEDQRDALKEIVNIAPQIKFEKPKKEKPSKRKKEEKDPTLNFFTEAMREAIDQSKILQAEIDSLYKIIESAPTENKQRLLKSTGLKDAENQLKKIEKRMKRLQTDAFFIDPKTGVELKKMKLAADAQRKVTQDAKLMEEHYKRAAEAIGLMKETAGVGIDISEKFTFEGLTEISEKDKKSVMELVGARKKVIASAKNLGVSTENTIAGLDKLADVGIEGGAMLSLMKFGESLMSFVTSIFSGDFSSVFEQVGAMLGQVGGMVANLIAPGLGEMLGPVMEVVGQSIGTFFDQMISRIEVPSISDPGKMYGMDEVINAAFEKPLKEVAPLFAPLAEGLHFLASNVGGLLADMTSAFGPTIGFLGNLFKMFSNIVFNVIGVLFPVFNMLGHIFNVVAMTFEPFISITSAVMNFLTIFGMTIMNFVATIVNSLMTLSSLVGGATTLAAALSYFAQLFHNFNRDFADAIAGFFEMIEKLISAAVTALDATFGPLTDTIESQLGSLASSIGDLAANTRAAGNNLGAFGDGMNNTIRYLDEANNLRNQENKEASKVLNAPKGFKVEKYRYEAMNPEQSNPFNLSGSQSSSNVTINIENMNVNDYNDFQEQINEANNTGGPAPFGGN